jgi:hypothetical protein
MMKGEDGTMPAQISAFQALQSSKRNLPRAGSWQKIAPNEIGGTAILRYPRSVKGNFVSVALSDMSAALFLLKEASCFQSLLTLIAVNS